MPSAIEADIEVKIDTASLLFGFRMSLFILHVSLLSIPRERVEAVRAVLMGACVRRLPMIRNAAGCRHCHSNRAATPLVLMVCSLMAQEAINAHL